MSFNPYDMIHTGNYESFFLLYIDQELSDVQMKMVDEFLAAHPELQSEFDMLVSTRLPMEHFSFDKESLMAENMYPGSVAEDLLLYMDNELPADKKNIIEFELASNKDYQLQFENLKVTRLDASEVIEYPNKKELYRNTERVIAFRPWMRVAAAVMVIALSGVIYLKKSGQPDINRQPDINNGIASRTIQQVNREQKKTASTPKNQISNIDNANPKTIASITSGTAKKETVKKKVIVQQENKDLVNIPNNKNLTLENEDPEFSTAKLSRPVITDQASEITKSVAATIHPVLKAESINKSIVTSESPERKPEVAKGSVKGFLRKATRLIEKRTGIDPTNDNGELLIGVVAMKLN